MIDETYCECMLKSLSDKPTSLYSTIFQGIFSFILCICGVFLNFKVFKKLKLERKRRPLGQRGNVIGPIMRWFSILQIIYWPLLLLFFWVHANSIIAVEMIRGWGCFAMVAIIAMGRSIIAYNSFFVGLVRYMYIVHRVKANQWNFETIGRLSQLGSIIIPTVVSFLMSSTFDLNVLWTQCGSSKRMALTFAQNYLPGSLVHILGMISVLIQVVVYLNITEAFLYMKIFRVIKR